MSGEVTRFRGMARHDGRKRRNFLAKVIMGCMLFFMMAFFISTIAIYRVLNHKIDSLMSPASQNITIAISGNRTDTSSHQTENITVTIHNMSDVSNEILKLKETMATQEIAIHRLNHLVDFVLNNTVAHLNVTVEKVQQDVNQQVQEVNENVNSQNSLMAYQFAGTFAILGSLISIWHMSDHVRNLNEPIVQRKIIAILWMIPIYSVSSWLGLVIIQAESFLGLIKDLYESYCIYTFLSFLIAVLGLGDREAVITLLASHKNHLKPPMRLGFWKKPRTFESPRHLAEAVLDQCQFFAMQFVFVRPLTSISILICDAIAFSRWDIRYPQFYIMMIANVSVFFAFTGLVKIYHAIREELKWCHPFAKFLCIKGVVFMTFWQGFVISFLAQAMYHHDDPNSGDNELDAHEWSKKAQSFLICLEMFFFAIVHCFVFPIDEWEAGYKEKQLQKNKAKFGDSLALRDFFRDVKLVMRKKKLRQKNMNQKNKKKRTKKKKNVDGYNETSLVDRSFDEVHDEDSLDESTELDMDIDWAQGWGGIEKYIDILEEEEEEEEDASEEGLNNRNSPTHSNEDNVEMETVDMEESTNKPTSEIV